MVDIMIFKKEIIVCYVLISLFRSITSKYTLKKVAIKKTIDGGHVKIFTSEELTEFDGSNPKGTIYIAIKGMVFDVTNGGKNFYGKDAPYNALTGKDSTRAVAKMSLDPSDLMRHTDDLSDETLRGLDEIVDSTYLPKYPIVGYMDYLLEGDGIIMNMNADGEADSEGAAESKRADL